MQGYLCPLPRNASRTPSHIGFSMLVYAHRGGPVDVDGTMQFENCMQAFTKAASLPADLLELDVQLTRDGVVVVCHDKQLGRLTGEPKYDGVRVADLLWSQLPPLKGGGRIPKLEEVFR